MKPGNKSTGLKEILLLLLLGILLYNLLILVKASENARWKDLSDAVVYQAKKLQIPFYGSRSGNEHAAGKTTTHAPKMSRLDYIRTITNPFPVRGARKHKQDGIGRVFSARELAYKDRLILMDLLSKFVEVADSLNIVYFLYGGSLIGSWRHHGFVPYDDDIDLLVNISQKTVLYEALKKLKPNYTGLIGGLGQTIKFWSMNSTEKIGTRIRLWPFLDIIFFDETETHVFDTLLPGKQHLKIDVFPLHKRPFEGIMVDAPKNTPKMLSKEYGVGRAATVCKTWSHSHRNGSRVSASMRKTAPCSTFEGVYPFVKRKFVGGRMEERLEIGKRLIHKMLIDEPRHSWTPMYTFHWSGNG